MILTFEGGGSPALPANLPPLYQWYVYTSKSAPGPRLEKSDCVAPGPAMQISNYVLPHIPVRASFLGQLGMAAAADAGFVIQVFLSEVSVTC